MLDDGGCMVDGGGEKGNILEQLAGSHLSFPKLSKRLTRFLKTKINHSLDQSLIPNKNLGVI